MSTASSVNNNSSDAEAVVHPLLDILLGGDGKEECIITAQSLTVSDQHATLLLTHTSHENKEGDDDGEKATAKKSSILKLTLVPYHKLLLGSNPVLSSNINKESSLERNTLNNDPIASANIISFLREYEYELKSESGAEYHYYIARPTTGGILNKKEEKNHNSINNVGAFDIELISPATPHQIMRSLPSLGHVLIHETPELYNKVVAPYIQTIIDNGSLAWITNVITGQKEKERLLVNNVDFIINIDTKWRTHPSPLTTHRSEWYNHTCTSDLYCLGITKINTISCIRDLRAVHIPLLQSLQQAGIDCIQDMYGIPSNQIRIFVHYQPQFYHFHVHFTRLENEVGSTVERGHMVCDIIQNLQLDDEYYKKRTITYKLARGMPLLSLIEEYQQ
jgi:m7GpppX diphosphatase